MIHLICGQQMSVYLKATEMQEGIRYTFCLRQAAQALTFLEMPGILESAAGTPFVESLRCGLAGPLARRGGGSSNEVRTFLGDVDCCAGEAYECGDVEEAARWMAGTERGEGRFASCQLRFDILQRVPRHGEGR